MNNFVIKTEDLGSSTPFVARLLLTILQFRDKTGLNNAKKKLFDDFYMRFYDHAKLAYCSFKELCEIHLKYMDEIEKGEIISINNNTLIINKEIDTDTSRLTNSILSEASIAFKELINNYSKIFASHHLGFMAKEEKTYQKMLLGVQEEDAVLAEYLESNRKEWTGKLIDIRNKKEHHGWSLPEYSIMMVDKKVVVAHPLINGMEYLQYLQFILASLFTFAEELMVYTLDKCVEFEYVYEIPKSERRSGVAARFNMCFDCSKYKPWTLKYNGPDMELTW